MGQRDTGGAYGFFDALFAEFRRAVGDIRENVVEHGWFGRHTRGPGADFGEQLGWRSPGESFDRHKPTFEELWGPRERGSDQPSPEREIGHDR